MHGPKEAERQGREEPCDCRVLAVCFVRFSGRSWAAQPGIERIHRSELGVNEHSFDTGTVVLNLAEGPAAGSPIVLLHGVARRWQDFSLIVPALAVRWTVHAIDFRGHGRSGRVARGYRVIDYVPDIVTFLRDRLTEPALVLGHSLGAMVAAAVAAQAPELVRAVVLEDPPLEMMGKRFGETLYRDLFVAFRNLAGSTRPIEDLAREIAQTAVILPGETVPTLLGGLRDAASIRFSAACLRRLDPQVLDPALDGSWIDGYDCDATLTHVVCPALFLQGDFALGGFLPDPVAREAASKLCRGTHIKMEGVGHQIHAMQAVAMMRLVVDFLESLD
jgi:pimeloyl-ACP methyl ester carboxylesterase